MKRLLIIVFFLLSVIPAEAQHYRFGVSGTLGFYPDPSATGIMANGLMEFKVNDTFAVQPELGLGGVFGDHWNSMALSFSIFGKVYPVRDRFYIDVAPSVLILTKNDGVTGFGFLFGAGYEFTDTLFGSFRSGHYSDGIGSPVLLTVGYKF